MQYIRRVVVGMSGGVDSAVTALLLKRRGHEVQGLFMQNWDIADEKGYCSADDDYRDAAWVCDNLGIKLQHVNFVKQYWNEVFCKLVNEYESGFTPNPDILCNIHIKFNYFYKYAVENLNADAIATGHYARTSFGPFLEFYKPNTDVRLLHAKDTRKDQTFFLCQIEQEALQRTMFPLGDMFKTEVKQIAIENNLQKIAKKKESMGICFIGSRNFQDFIKEYIQNKPGDFIDIDTGKVVGKHEGIHQWTLGQRTRLEGLPEAYFTARKDPQKNTIYVARGTKHPLLHSSLVFTEKPHWIHSRPSQLNHGKIFECQFKFQHSEHWIDCLTAETSKGLVIKLSKHKRAITPGQYAVLSKNGECLGSARIANTGVSNYTLYYLENNSLKKVSDTIKQHDVNLIRPRQYETVVNNDVLIKATSG